MNGKVIGWVAAAAVGGAVVGAVLFQHRHAPDDQTAPRASIAAQETKTQAPVGEASKTEIQEAKLRELQTETARLRAKVASLMKATNAAGTAAKKDDEMSDVMKTLANMMGDGGTNGEGGGFMKMIQAQLDGQVNGQIARMKTRLNLTPDQEAKVRAMLDQQMKAGMDVGMKVLNGKATAAEIEAAQKPSTDPGDIKSILTPEQQTEYAKMQVEDRQNNARLMANQNVLVLQGTLGLNQDQQDKLYNVFYQSAETQLGGGTENADGSPANPLDFRGKLEKDLTAMKDILTPDQLAQYKTLQEQQIVLMESLMMKGKK